jgi:hypothetical protein
MNYVFGHQAQSYYQCNFALRLHGSRRPLPGINLLPWHSGICTGGALSAKSRSDGNSDRSELESIRSTNQQKMRLSIQFYENLFPGGIFVRRFAIETRSKNDCITTIERRVATEKTDERPSSDYHQN